MVAQHTQTMIRSAIDLLMKGALGISLVDLMIMTLTQTTTIDTIIGKWLQILFTVIGMVYFIASWPHKRAMQKIAKERALEELRKLKSQNDTYDTDN